MDSPLSRRRQKHVGCTLIYLYLSGRLHNVGTGLTSSLVKLKQIVFMMLSLCGLSYLT